jgi:hypothetical protein
MPYFLQNRTGWLQVLLLLASCSTMHEIEVLPPDTYRVDLKDYQVLVDRPSERESGKVNVSVEVINGVLHLDPEPGQLPNSQIPLADITNFKLHRHTFDVDLFTIPFKIRPETEGFPVQLKPNFSGALYVGKRQDYYRIKSRPNQKLHPVRLTGAGYGYGALVGMSSVTMNPFVTNNQIAYEYEGLALLGGVAGIYDAKKFNLGLAIGTDFLLDKNRKYWLYQGKPWIGGLFGINLN